MRRATSPAIWVKPIRSAVRALDQEMLPLIVLARLVEVGVEELARHIGDALRRGPVIGERLMCTSNTLMKIETRVYSPSARPSAPRSSGGGGTLAIIVISPSAGATIKLSPRGVVRIGSRKKAATQMVSADAAASRGIGQCQQEADERDGAGDDGDICGPPG